jgi:hypothetical protein
MRAVVMLALALAVSAQAVNMFDKGQFWTELEPAEKAVYSLGFLDGFVMAHSLANPDQDSQFATLQRQASDALGKCVSPMTSGQIEAIITKYVREHPERWDKPRAYVVTMAIAAACRERPADR